MENSEIIDSAIASSIISICYELMNQYHHIVRFIPSERLRPEYFTLLYRYFEQLNDTDALYHYTSLETCEKILTSDNIFLFESQNMNDKLEGKFAQNLLDDFLIHFRKDYHPSHLFLYRDELDAYSAITSSSRYFDFSYSKITVKRLNKYFGNLNLTASSLLFLFCLSNPATFDTPPQGRELPFENLNMWVAYGDKGRGVCLKLYKADIYSIIRETDLSLRPVIYDSSLQAQFLRFVYRILHDVINKNSQILDAIVTYDLRTSYSIKSYLLAKKNFQFLINEVMKIYYSIAKHPCFAQENEWRLIYNEAKFKSQYVRSIEIPNKGEVPYVSLSDMISEEEKTSLKSHYGGKVLPVAEIIFGPAIDIETKVEFCRKHQKILNDNRVYLRDSNLPYRG